jgi:LPS O-antigen subunit length determinant protein (WzzB/FepE family)
MKDQDRTIKEEKLVKEDEIDLIALIKPLWESRQIVIKTIIIFTFIGLLVALFSEKEYEASTIMVPQIDNPSSQLGGLSSLASLAGFNMNMNAGVNDISPKLYPMIISSVNFQLEIMNEEYQFDDVDKPISLIDYYVNFYRPGLFGIIKKYTIGLPGLIKSGFQRDRLFRVGDSESGTIKLTMDQYEVRKIIAKKLTLAVNDKDGYLTLISRFHQAFLSAQIAQKSQKLLQEYVTQFKIEKATAQLEFIRERYEVSKGEFEEAQSKLAAYRDANKNISSEIMRTHEERLQNEYQLAFDVYSELAKQLEQSLIKVEEDTPVFSVINEVVVPIERSKPKRSVVLIVFFFLGGIIGILWVYGKNFLKSLKRQWKDRPPA